ncbi:hypothetical protein M1O54_07675 [Dehalococcoidia bacterium]|nr:hypothetical protein [Dehalococcoidia bacterium]
MRFGTRPQDVAIAVTTPGSSCLESAAGWETIMRGVLGLKKFFYSVLIAVLAFSALPAFVVGSGSAENQYATVVWQTSVSKERLDRGEMFYGTLNLVSTIKAIPEA